MWRRVNGVGADVGERLELAPGAAVEDHRHADVGALVQRVEQLAVVRAEVAVAARDHVRRAVAEQLRGERVLGQLVRLGRREAILARPELADVDQGPHAIVLALPAADRDRRGADDAARLLADDLQHVLEPVGGGHGAGDGDQRAQLGLGLRRSRPARAPRSSRPAGRRASASSAAIVRGQNCVPAWRWSSARASALRQRRAVRAVRGHRVPRVAGEADAARQRDVGARQAVGVAGAVPALVLGADRRRQVRERRDRGDDALAHRRVRPHDQPLGLVEAARLLQDRLRHAELADVVQERDLGRLHDLVVREARAAPPRRWRARTTASECCAV